ncbi:hypothetical protein KSP40_PGU015851 [Platanthera guangdongensis]|uniref:GTD-binding domain-containing protein n=1 Tax=Platanthera guangdongensis TaxID=2320717 RepID=A0ABR2LE46_9ASPA
MACRAIEIWTVSSLIGAYLDLALAHLFLVGATTAFFTSKILSLFGLSLPCSCDGHFGHPACSQFNLLVDFPVSKVAAVNKSLLSRFPYDSILSAGDSASPRCRYAGLPNENGGSCTPVPRSCPSRSLSLPAPPNSLLRRRHQVPRSDLNLEKIPPASAQRISCGLWFSDDQEICAVLAEEAMDTERDLCSGIEAVSKCDHGDIMDMSKSLKRDFEEEKIACSALYLELEKERLAASTAADEAMAMILRLQKEKAVIEMESRQYQRMIEEKSSYDEEEMVVLKEIIVRRERENLVLQKEVEMHKQMLASLEIFEQAFDSDQKILEEKVKTSDELLDKVGDFGVESSPAVGNSMQDFVDAGKQTEYHHEILEDVLTKQIKPFSNILKLSCAEDSIVCSLDKDIADLTVNDADQRDRSSLADTELCIHDIHTVNGVDFLEVEENKKGSMSPEVKFSRLDPVELNIKRSCSEITNMSDILNSSSYFNLRRSSLPSVESQRHELETEVEILKKRLVSIREGREKLNLSTDHKEKEAFQLQFLDEITFQLKEIKKVTEPMTSFRRASLPTTRLRCSSLCS